jgi:hypothetical protein
MNGLCLQPWWLRSSVLRFYTKYWSVSDVARQDKQLFECRQQALRGFDVGCIGALRPTAIARVRPRNVPGLPRALRGPSRSVTPMPLRLDARWKLLGLYAVPPAAGTRNEWA